VEYILFGVRDVDRRDSGMAFVYPHRHLRSYVHNGRVGVLVEIGCQSDFTVRTPEFDALAHAIALQIAAMAPHDVGALYAQEFVQDPLRTVERLIDEAARALHERVGVTRFIRWSADDDWTAGPPPSNRPDPDPPRTPGVIFATGAVAPRR
jgi:elongation factor Ts